MLGSATLTGDVVGAAATGFISASACARHAVLLNGRGFGRDALTSSPLIHGLGLVKGGEGHVAATEDNTGTSAASAVVGVAMAAPKMEGDRLPTSVASAAAFEAARVEIGGAVFSGEAGGGPMAGLALDADGGVALVRWGAATTAGVEGPVASLTLVKEYMAPSSRFPESGGDVEVLAAVGGPVLSARAARASVAVGLVNKM